MAKSGGLGSLSVDLLLEVAEWVTGLNKAEHEAEKFADAIGNKLEGMANSALGSLKKIAAGAIAAFAVENVVGFINETQKAADALDEMAQKTGASLQFLAQMSVSAQMSGTSVEGLASALGKFNKATAEAFKDRTSDPAKAFADLGVSVTDTAGRLKSSESLFLEAAEAISKIEDAALRSAAAQQLFGKSGAELIPLMMSLANQSQELKDVTKAYGEQMTILAPIAGALEESQAVLVTQLKTFAAILGEQVIPYVSALVSSFSALDGEAGKISATTQGLVNAFKGVVMVVDSVVTALGALITLLALGGVAVAKMLAGDFAGASRDAREALDALQTAGSNWIKRMDAMADPLSQTASKTGELKKEVSELDEALKRATGGLAGGIARTAEEWVVLIEKKQAFDAAMANFAWIETNRKAHETAAKKAAAEWDKAARARESSDKEMQRMADRSVDQLFDSGTEKYRNQLDALRNELKAEEALKKESQELTDKYERDMTARRLKDEERAYGDLYKGIENAGRSAFDALFSDTKGGWEGMLTSLKNSFKKILIDYIYQQLARPFVMKMVASMPGGMGQYGANQLGAATGDWSGGFNWSGMASGATELYNSWFGAEMPNATSELAALGTQVEGTTTALSSFEYGLVGIAGGIGGYFAAKLYGAGDRGVANATSYGAAGAVAGAYIGSIVPVLGTAVGAIIGWAIGTIVGISTDPDPDAMRKAKFGNITGASEGVTKWTGQSAFGKFGFSEGEWLSDEQMDAAMSNAIKGISTLDNTLAQFMTDEQVENVKKKLAEVSKVYELGMEHLDVQGLGELIKDRLSIITGEFHKGLQEFVDKFDGETQDLVAIVASFMQAKTAADLFDVDEILEKMRPRKAMDVYQEQRGTLEELVPTVDATADSMNGLVTQLLAFQTATVQMVAAIDAAAESMHNMFMSTREKIEMSQMTPEQRYNYLQAQTEELYKQLETETDPAEIAKLAAKINANINAAWELLTPEQQQAMADSFTTRLTMLDDAVALKMGALREVVIEDAEGVMSDITDRLEKVFMTADAAAAAQAAAAAAQQKAADTPHTVVVLVGDDGTVRAAG